MCSVPKNGETPTELDDLDFKGLDITFAMYNVDEENMIV